MQIKDSAKKAISLLLFLAFMFVLFSAVTYLFRNADVDRERIVGIKNEVKNVDVVYIGASDVFSYWEPLKAYSDYGFTSYDLASSAIGAECILPCIKYAEKYCDPDLYIISTRTFQYYTDGIRPSGLRHFTDGLDITYPPRYYAVHSYLNNRSLDESENIPSYYIDIFKLS